MDWDGVDGRIPTAREIGERLNHPRAKPRLRSARSIHRGALPYIKVYNREASGRGSGGIGIRLHVAAERGGGEVDAAQGEELVQARQGLASPD